jgi:antitoxin component of RelBE/YafQ-DinJ toxin-antitoxin module
MTARLDRPATKPFDYHIPNAETIAAMQECEDMRSGKIPKYTMPVADFFKELGIAV